MRAVKGENERGKRACCQCPISGTRIKRAPSFGIGGKENVSNGQLGLKRGAKLHSLGAHFCQH